MEYYIDVTKKLWTLELKENTGKTTFSFRDGNYEFSLEVHVGAEILWIFLIDEEKKDELFIFKMGRTNYVNSEFPTKGVPQGFQVWGPWVEGVERLIAKYEGEIEAEQNRRAEIAGEIQKEQRLAEKRKIQKFNKLA